MKKDFKKYIIIVLALVLLPNSSSASRVFFETSKDVNNKGDEFYLNVYLDTQGQSINAIEGSIVFTQDILVANDVVDGNSAINFWINKPKISQNIITYSGLTPAGIIGNKRLLFKIIFSGNQIGEGKVFSSETTVLMNDGEGTKVSNSEDEISIKIKDLESKDAELIDIYDIDSPEVFVPIIANDPSILNGANFLVFATQDKASGVDYYEVKEGFFGKYTIENSPYLIKDQSLKKTLYVKAVDNNGNQIVVSVNSSKNNILYPILVFVGIILWIIYYRKNRSR